MVPQSMIDWMKNRDLQLDTTTREALIDLLSPLMHTDNERRALLSLAFKNEPVYRQIDFEGSAGIFTANMIDKLVYFGGLSSGEQALFALLATVKSQVGVNKQKVIEDLIFHINAHAKQNSAPLLTPQKLRLILLVVIPLLLLAFSIWYISPPSLFVRNTGRGDILTGTLSITSGQPISISQGLTITQNAHSCAPARICILVAEISPEDNSEAREITADITQKIYSALELFPTSQSDNYMVRPGPSVNNSQEAKELAVQEGAILVIWGTVRKSINQLQIQFELVDLFGVGESTNIRAERIEPLSYKPMNQQEECFNCAYMNISTKVAQRVKVIAYTAVGLTKYVQEQPEQARNAFLATLYCAGEINDTQIITANLVNLQSDCVQKEKLSDWNPGLLYYYLGKSLILQGDYKAGVSYLEQAATLNPSDPAAWISIGDAYQIWLAQPHAQDAIKHLDKAEELIQKLIKDLSPSEQGPVYYDWGVIRELKEDPSGAQEHYQAAAGLFVEDKSSAYVSLVNLGRIQRISKDSNIHDSAEQTLEKAHKLVARSPWAYLELARLHKNEWAKAKTFLDQAEEYAPNEAYVYITRAELCNKQWQAHQQPADYDCAVTAYAKALTLRPYSGWVYSLVGDFYLPTDPPLSGQDWAKAEEHYRKAAQLRPKDPWVHERLAYVLYNLTKYSEAVDQYNQAISLAYQGGVPAQLYCKLAVAQQANGQAAEAAKSQERCSTAPPQK